MGDSRQEITGSQSSLLSGNIVVHYPLGHTETDLIVVQRFSGDDVSILSEVVVQFVRFIASEPGFHRV